MTAVMVVGLALLASVLSATAFAAAQGVWGLGTGRANAGRLLLTAVALATSVSPYLADWNETHIYNANWPPHAKFHNAQTMLLGALLGASALWLLWRPGADRRSLAAAAWFAALYWLAQSECILFPGADYLDPEFAEHAPRALGFTLNQNVLSAVVLALILLGYRVGRTALRPSVHTNKGVEP